LTYVLVMFAWIGVSGPPTVTHIDGYRSFQACQAALSQIAVPLPIRISAICLPGPDRSSMF
jgi:hypothetical protein